MKREEFNQIIENVKWRIDRRDYNGAIEELMDKLYEYDFIDELIFQEFIDMETMDDLMRQQAHGWETATDLYFRLGGIDDISEDLFKIDGYGYIRNITKDDMECLILDIEREIELED